MLVLQALEPHCRGQSYLSKHVLRDAIAVQLVNRPAVHELDADVHRALLKEGAVKVDDVGRDAAVQDVELHDYGCEFGVVQL